MAATISKEEEELLIISDDEELTSEININIEEQKEPEVDPEVITFGDEPENKDDVKTESSSIDLDFNLGGEEQNVTVEEMLGKKADALADLKDETKESTTEDIFDFSLDSDEKVEEVLTKEEESSNDEISLDFGDSIKEDSLEIKDDKSSDVELVFGDIEETKEDNLLELNNNEEKNTEESASIVEENLVEIAAVIPAVVATQEKKPEVKEKTNKKIEKDNTEIEVVNQEISGNKKDDGKSDDSKKDDGKSDDTNTILNETIKKLKARKKEIVELKKKTLADITDLKEEIKVLQAEVRKGNKAVKDDDRETAKIEENIKLLTKMKI